MRKVMAAHIEPDDELDLDGDDYGDNELAQSSYARVFSFEDAIDDDGDLIVILTTSQINFSCPANHYLKVKNND